MTSTWNEENKTGVRNRMQLGRELYFDSLFVSFNES
jgi:hypothetical protein